MTDEDVLSVSISVDSHYSHHLPQITRRSLDHLEWIADIIDYLYAID